MLQSLFVFFNVVVEHNRKWMIDENFLTVKLTQKRVKCCVQSLQACVYVNLHLNLTCKNLQMTMCVNLPFVWIIYPVCELFTMCKIITICELCTNCVNSPLCELCAMCVNYFPCVWTTSTMCLNLLYLWTIYGAWIIYHECELFTTCELYITCMNYLHSVYYLPCF